MALRLNVAFCGLNDPARKCPFHLGKTRPVRPKTAPEPYRAEMGLQIFRAARSIFDGDGGSRAPLLAAPYSHAARRPGSPRTSHITKCNFHDWFSRFLLPLSHRPPPATTTTWAFRRATRGWAGGGKCPCGLKYVVLRLKLTAIKRRNLPLWPKRGVVFFPNQRYSKYPGQTQVQERVASMKRR